MASIEVSDETNSQNHEDVIEEEIDDLDESNKADETPKDKKMKGAIQSIMKNMVSSKQPFYKISLPICFSEPRSLLERLTDFGQYLDIFLNASKIESSETRFLEILKFYLSSWVETKDVRSPFNPVIGETFECKWNHDDGSTTEYVSEQISHHPPTSAFIFYNRQRSLLMHAYILPTSKFWGNSLESSMDGKVIFELPKYGEEYICELPKIGVKGIVVGSLQTELSGSPVLTCKKTGYYAEMEFKGKGHILKNKNMMIAKVRHPSSKRSLYTLEVKWDGTVTILTSKSNTTNQFFDINTTNKNEKQVEELNKQPETSSQRVWEKVIHNIKVDNEEEAQTQKNIVEENQRVLAKTREGTTWSPIHFQKADNTYFYNQLDTLRKEMSS